MSSCMIHTNNWMTRRQNNFEAKYGNGKNITEKLNNLGKELEDLEERLKRKIHLDLCRATLKKEPNQKSSGHDCIYGH